MPINMSSHQYGTYSKVLADKDTAYLLTAGGAVSLTESRTSPVWDTTTFATMTYLGSETRYWDFTAFMCMTSSNAAANTTVTIRKNGTAIGIHKCVRQAVNTLISVVTTATALAEYGDVFTVYCQGSVNSVTVSGTLDFKVKT